MQRTKPLCGAIVKSGSTCRNAVAFAGARCHLHPETAPKRGIFALCVAAVEKVLAACTLYEAYEKLYPLVAPHVHQLGGLLMPEHFWLALDRNDRLAMQTELEKAKENADRLINRYEGYSPADKRRVERAYRAIIRHVSQLRRRARITL